MQSISYETVAYYLRLSLEHLNSLPEPEDREYGEVEDFDALIYEPTAPEGFDSSFLDRVVPYQGPEPLNWLGFLNRLHQTDFLSDKFLCPLISKRMLYVLRSVGNFPHKAIPVRIFDYDLSFGNRLDQYLCEQELPPNICNQDYVLLQLLEFTNAVDPDLSEYEDSSLNRIIPPQITHMVLREPAEGFPPIFCIPEEFRNNLYISSQAKQALEDAGIRGLEFFPEEGVRAGSANAR
jgi:hypothetical protein